MGPGLRGGCTHTGRKNNGVGQPEAAVRTQSGCAKGVPGRKFPHTGLENGSVG